MPRPCGSQWTGTCKDLKEASMAIERVNVDEGHDTVRETKAYPQRLPDSGAQTVSQAFQSFSRNDVVVKAI